MDKEEKAKVLVELGGIDEGIYDSLVAEHLNQTKDRCLEIRKFLDENDIEQVADLAHSVKGSSGNLRLQRLYEAAQELEAAAKSGDASTSLSLLLDTLEKENNICIGTE